MNAPIRPEQASEHIDDRLLFLVRARARLILVEAGEMTLDEALEGLVEPICDCQRWPLAAQWERTHPHRRDYRRRWGRT
jgi:hypothetical protein